MKTMRAIFLVFGVAVLSGALMVTSIFVVLPLAFDTQGVGWRAAPLRTALVWLGSGLLAPLEWRGATRGSPRSAEWGFGSVLVLSVAYGLLALGVRSAWRARQRSRRRAR